MAAHDLVPQTSQVQPSEARAGARGAVQAGARPWAAGAASALSGGKTGCALRWGRARGALFLTEAARWLWLSPGGGRPH